MVDLDQPAIEIRAIANRQGLVNPSLQTLQSKLELIQSKLREAKLLGSFYSKPNSFLEKLASTFNTPITS